MSLRDPNLRILKDLGVDIDPLSTHSGLKGFDDDSSEGVYSAKVSIPRTRQILARESAYLLPRFYSSSVSSGVSAPCVGHEDHGDSDCHLNLLVQELVSSVQGDAVSNPSMAGHSALILVGVVSPFRLLSSLQ